MSIFLQIKIIIAISILAIIFFPSIHSFSLLNTRKDCIDLNKELLAYYPFSNSANDFSGNGKNGILINGTKFTTDAHGKKQSAVMFDGIDDYITIKDRNNYFSRDNISISLQFNLRNVNKRSTLFCKNNFETGSGVAYGFGMSVDNQPMVDFTVANPSGDCNSIWYFNPASTLISKTKLIPNKWYHALVVFNRGVQIIYINGKLDSYKIGNNRTLKKCTSADFKIGGWWKNDIISINGKVDELRIYSRVLCDEEIKLLARQLNN